jgi:mycofactocin system glycosyltransferase
VSRLSAAARPTLERVIAAGARGATARDRRELAVFRVLLDRGFATPVPHASAAAPEVTVVIPVLDQPELLDSALTSLGGTVPVVVVDDGSADPRRVRAAADRHGAQLVRHPVNRGPAAARNTGLAAATTDAVAFLDADCVAPPGWPQSMLHHFSDPAVAVVAPRVLPSPGDGGVVDRFESCRSALDMGPLPELVRPGARLGFVPSAALVARREAVGAGFDEDLRLGEDVDLVWRLDDGGWQVRYDPTVVVRHAPRAGRAAWLTRRLAYGTSAPALARRHPGRLVPARVSGWNLAVLGLGSTGRWQAGTLVAAGATAALARRLRAVDGSVPLAARVVGQGIVADAAGIGHALRREWWPLGALALALTPRSSVARAAAACMLGPVAWELVTQHPPLDPARYTALRLVEDAAYGTGVLVSSARAGTAAPLLPFVRLPRRPRGILRATAYLHP